MHFFQGYFAKRNQNKGTLVQTGMGNLKPGLLDDPLAKKKNVEIDFAGRVPDRTFAPEFSLNLIKLFA